MLDEENLLISCGAVVIFGYLSVWVSLQSLLFPSLDNVFSSANFTLAAYSDPRRCDCLLFLFACFI